MNPPARKNDGKNKEEKFFLFEKTAVFGFFGSLIGIYISILTAGPPNVWLSPAYLSFTAGIGMILAIVWASDAVRKISKYGLGTGVPSVGMFSIGTACIIAVFAVFLNTIWSVVIGAILALIIGQIFGKLINRVLGMNIPSMETRFAEMTAGCTIAVMASFTVVIGSPEILWIYSGSVFSGIIALGFIGISVAVFHAYNANLGPDEKPDRTKYVAVLDASMILLIFGAVSLFLRMGSGVSRENVIGSTVIIFMSIAFILISYYKFWTCVKRDAWKIEKTGLLPNEEELN